MSEPLDLDAIRERLAYLDEADFRIDGTNAVIVKMATLVGTNVPALLAEVERLRANQMPDGGDWRTELGILDEDGWLPLTTGNYRATHRRRVWYGPVEPIDGETA